MHFIKTFSQIGMADVPSVGGKNASLGEMFNHLSQAGVAVPDGFATTAEAFREFLRHNGLTEKISAALDSLDVRDVQALAETGKAIRDWVMQGAFQPEFEAEILTAYTMLSGECASGVPVAVRSSATAEDLPNASFAGQQETYLRIQGGSAVLAAVKMVFASLYNYRAIAYRVHQGFAHAAVALSAGVQRMVRSDIGAAGVMFTLDTESGFDQVVFINGAYGLGEMVVQGAVTPDEFYVHKPMLQAGKLAVVQRTLGSKAVQMVYAEKAAGQTVQAIDTPAEKRQQFCLDDFEIMQLARYAMAIEQHYGRPMDIEWAKDGESGGLYIVQARPETVQARAAGGELVNYRLEKTAKVLLEGRSIGQKIGSGPVRVVLHAADMQQVEQGDVLVTDMTDPDWEPVMKRASAIVTNRGGRTCHAAIIARELGIPAIVGAVAATDVLKTGQEVTVSCAEGEIGYVYAGKLPFKEERLKLDAMPQLPLKLMMNVGNPERAFGFSRLPNDGVGLARLEFIIARMIGVHPRAILELPQQPSELQQAIREHAAGYASPLDWYVDKLSEGVATLAAAFWPKPVIVRFSDFKSNEYANLLGGTAYEPNEENPMLGFRGASRYASEQFAACFELECRAMLKVRNVMGLTNLQLMIPFVRTVDEAKAALDKMSEFGLRRGENDLKVMMMCEIPSNVLSADAFLQLFDGFSIGSNDLTQLTLGVDRDSALVAGSFDERDPAVKMLLSMAIEACKRNSKYIGICGQGPSDHPDLAEWLMQQGIGSMSLNPDTVVATWMRLAQ